MGINLKTATEEEMDKAAKELVADWPHLEEIQKQRINALFQDALRRRLSAKESRDR